MQIDTDLLITWGASIKKFCRGKIIFMEGDEARHYYQIISGEVRLFNTNLAGKEFTQGIFYSGNSFGEPPLFINEPYPATAIAVRETVIIKISSGSFFRIMEEYPYLQKDLIKEFAQRIFNKSSSARDITNNPPELRILGLLHSLKKKATDEKRKLMVPFTRQEIANLTGLRVETVIRTLMKMKNMNKVDIIDHKLYY